MIGSLVERTCDVRRFRARRNVRSPAPAQTPGAIVDLIGPGGANGNAVLRIMYSDGSEGILGVGCHGPGAPDGIGEGIIATKNFVTYWDEEAPVPGVNANRTSFHIQ